MAWFRVRRGLVRVRRGLVRVRRCLVRVRRGLVRVRRDLVRVRRGLVDSAPDCYTAVPGSIPPPGTPPSENFCRKPSADDLLSAGRKPQRRIFNEDESCKILYCKSRKNKLKRVPARAQNYY